MALAKNSSTGPHIVITGATRGLGRALTSRFHEAGWHVSGCGRSAEQVDALRAAHPGRHRFEVVDVVRADDVAAWADRVVDELGPPDLLIVNAAVINIPRPLWEVPPEEFASVVDVNLKGMFHTLRAFLPSMCARGRGVVVNLSSGWGRSTSPEVAPYCASKWGVEGLTQSLAQELPEGLAAVALNPGIIDTDMLRTCWPTGAAAYAGAETWSRKAAPFLMSLSVKDNGRSLTVPGE